MKFDPTIVIYILRMVLCNEAILSWLREEAKKSATPIDDTAVSIVEMLLCPKA